MACVTLNDAHRARNALRLASLLGLSAARLIKRRRRPKDLKSQGRLLENNSNSEKALNEIYRNL